MCVFLLCECGVLLLLLFCFVFGSFSHLHVTSPKGATLAKPWHPPWQKSCCKKSIYTCDVRALGNGWFGATDSSVVSGGGIRGRNFLGLLREWGRGHPVQACSLVSVKADCHLAHGTPPAIGQRAQPATSV